MADEQIWRQKGFATAPTQQTSRGGELIYRAYGGANLEIGGYYFAPRDARSHIMFSKLTRDDLEGEINAALYDNPISEIGVFKMAKDVVYLIGDIEQDFFPGAKSIYFMGAGVSPLVQILIEPPLETKVTKVG